MMGQHDRSEALFYYFRLEDQVPETHLLRLIEKHISFAFVREKLKASYSDTGRPSIDPELLLRILLIGYLYGITSERKLVEELRMHLAWRWFTGLGFDQEIPHHSTFSKNRHGRFQESKLFEELFEQIVRQCVEVGLVQGKHLSVDGSFVEANAAKESRIPREQLAEAAQVQPHRAPVSGGTGAAEPGRRAGASARPGVDHRSRFDLRHQGRHTGPAGILRQLSGRQSQLRDRGSASDGSTDESGNGGRARHAHSFHAMARTRARIGSGRHDLRERGVLAMVGGSQHHSLYANPRQYPQKEQSILRSRAFHVSTGKQSAIICPAGQPLNYGGRMYRNRAYAYIGTRKRCGACSLKAQCTSAAFRVSRHPSWTNRPGNAHGSWSNTPEFAKAQRQRKKVEALFAELKNQIGLRRLRLRRLKFVREQFFLAAVAQNIKRLVRFLSQPTTPTVEAAT